MKKLNKDIEEKAKKLNQWILDQEIVKEYKKYEDMISRHPELKEQEEKLKMMQKQIVNFKHQGIPCDQLIHDYQMQKKAFDENPIIYNYLVLKTEVNELLTLIQKNMNQQLEKMID